MRPDRFIGAGGRGVGVLEGSVLWPPPPRPANEGMQFLHGGRPRKPGTAGPGDGLRGRRPCGIPMKGAMGEKGIVIGEEEVTPSLQQTT